MKSILQREKKCYITGAENVPLHKHHIFGGPNRRISEEHGFYIYLRPELHNMSDEGIHFNKTFDQYIKAKCQREYEKTHTREEFMRLIGRNYSPEEDDR